MSGNRKYDRGEATNQSLRPFGTNTGKTKAESTDTLGADLIQRRDARVRQRAAARGARLRFALLSGLLPSPVNLPALTRVSASRSGDTETTNSTTRLSVLLEEALWHVPLQLTAQVGVQV